MNSADTLATLHSGKQKRDMDDLERDYVAPLAEVMRENEIDVDDLGLYLIARHAEERNNYIAEINPEMPEGGSGMSTEDAKRLIGEMENAAMNQAAQIVYDMLAANRKRMKDFGLVDEDTVDAWQDRYQFYVPLKGFATSKGMERRTFPREATFRRDSTCQAKRYSRRWAGSLRRKTPSCLLSQTQSKDRQVSKS